MGIMLGNVWRGMRGTCSGCASDSGSKLKLRHRAPEQVLEVHELGAGQPDSRNNTPLSYLAALPCIHPGPPSNLRVCWLWQRRGPTSCDRACGRSGSDAPCAAGSLPAGAQPPHRRCLLLPGSSAGQLHQVSSLQASHGCCSGSSLVCRSGFRFRRPGPVHFRSISRVFLLNHLENSESRQARCLRAAHDTARGAFSMSGSPSKSGTRQRTSTWSGASRRASLRRAGGREQAPGLLGRRTLVSLCPDQCFPLAPVCAECTGRA